MSEQRFIELLLERRAHMPKRHTEYKIDYSLYSQSKYKPVSQFGGGAPLSFKQMIPSNSSGGKGLGTASGPLGAFPACSNYTNLAEYQLQGFLGKGSYAQVRQAVHKQTGFAVAIKIYDKFKLSENREVKKSVAREISLLSALSGTSRRGGEQSAVSVASSTYSAVLLENQGDFGRGHANIMRLFDAIDTQR